MRIRVGAAQTFRQSDQRAEVVPKSIFNGCHRQIATVRSPIDLVTRAATRNERVVSLRPIACCKSLPESPVGEWQQVFPHRDVQVSSFTGSLASQQRK